MTTLGPYAALDHVFEVDVTTGDDPTLAALFAPLAAGGPATHTYEIALPDGDEPGWIGLADRRVPKQELSSIHSRLLLEVGQAAEASTDEPILHGCLLELDGVGVLVAGRSGSGKSTLTARLLGEGASLVTEDLTVLDERGAVRPYPRPVALSSSSFEALGRELPEDDCGCGCMKYALHPEELGGRVGERETIDVVVLCDRDGTGVQERSLPDTLEALFKQASVGHVDGLDQMARVARALAGARCVELGTQDLDQAVAELTAVLGEPRTPVVVGAEAVAGGTVVYLDGEAIIRVEHVVHHLDAAATAVWVLHTEGLSAEAIAAELDWDAVAVQETLQRLRELELPAPVG